MLRRDFHIHSLLFSILLVSLTWVNKSLCIEEDLGNLRPHYIERGVGINGTLLLANGSVTTVLNETESKPSNRSTEKDPNRRRRHARTTQFPNPRGFDINTTYLEVPVEYDPVAGWYAWFRVGPNPATSAESAVEYKLGIDLRGHLTFLTSIEQPISQQTNPKTGIPHPLASVYSNEWNVDFGVTRNAPTELFTVPYFDENQRFIEGREDRDLPLYQGFSAGRNQLSTDNITILSQAMVLISNQNAKDDFDGIFGLGPIYKGGPGRISNSSWLWEWNGDGSFGVSFASQSKAHLQLGVSGLQGDPRSYDQDFWWFKIVWGNQPDTRYLALTGVRIGDQVLQVSDADWRRWEAYWWTETQRLESYNLTEANSFISKDFLGQKIETISNAIHLDSISIWSRLHPLIVWKLYGELKEAIYTNSTWYLPCSFDYSKFPRVEVVIEDNTGSFRSFKIVDRRSFLNLRYRHKQDEGLCAGTIQSICAGCVHLNRYKYTDPYPLGDAVNQTEAFGVLGRSFIQQHYFLFKFFPGAGKGKPTQLLGIGMLNDTMRDGYEPEDT
ncbi:hypothetical protein TWF281_003857 [Arthrobotrys megalospora]